MAPFIVSIVEPEQKLLILKQERQKIIKPKFMGYVPNVKRERLSLSNKAVGYGINY